MSLPAEKKPDGDDIKKKLFMVLSSDKNMCMAPRKVVAEKMGIPLEVVVEYMESREFLKEISAMCRQAILGPAMPAISMETIKNAMAGDVQWTKLYYELVGARENLPKAEGLMQEMSLNDMINRAETIRRELAKRRGDAIEAEIGEKNGEEADGQEGQEDVAGEEAPE